MPNKWWECMFISRIRWLVEDEHGYLNSGRTSRNTCFGFCDKRELTAIARAAMLFQTLEQRSRFRILDCALLGWPKSLTRPMPPLATCCKKPVRRYIHGLLPGTVAKHAMLFFVLLLENKITNRKIGAGRIYSEETWPPKGKNPRRAIRGHPE